MTRKSFSIRLSAPKAFPTVELDALTLVDTRMLVAGSSGSGKSYMMRVIAEQAAPKLQTIILDPDGEYTTLREKVDVVIVGREGEVVPTVPTAAKLARKLLELEVSAVIDLYDLKISERRAYVRHFLDSLMNVPKKLWRPCLIMLDEAHKFCPERSSGQAESTDAVITLLSQGRKRGFCGILATQRLQKLHKDAAAETLNNLIGRTSLDVDVRRARDILGLPKGDESNLRALKPGNWYGFGPAFVEIDGVCQFKATKATTTHPEPGKRHTLRAPAPSAKIRRVLPELAELPQEAAKEAEDLASAKARIKDLERQARQLRRTDPAPVVDRAAIDQAVARALDKQQRAYERALDKADTKVEAVLKSNATALGRALKDVVDSFVQSTTPSLQEVLRPAVQGVHESVADKAVRFGFEAVDLDVAREKKARRPTARASRSGANGSLGGGMRRIMIALACAGPSTRTDISILSCMSPRGGTFGTYLSRLKSNGYIVETDDGRWDATETGIVALGDYEPVPTAGEDLVERWRDKVGGGGIGRMFDALWEAGEDGLTKERLAERSDMDAHGGSFGTYISRLRKKHGIAEDSWPIRLRDVFFR